MVRHQTGSVLIETSDLFDVHNSVAHGSWLKTKGLGNMASGSVKDGDIMVNFNGSDDNQIISSVGMDPDVWGNYKKQISIWGGISTWKSKTIVLGTLRFKNIKDYKRAIDYIKVRVWNP